MPEQALDVAVIGAGQAGLGISYFLKQYGLRHVVFERGKIGESWRTQRWDSFALNSPNKFNVLPGETYSGPNPDGFDPAKSFVTYLEGYANRFQLPVQEQTRVVSVERNGAGYHVAALVKGATRQYACKQVVVASGAMNELKAPSFAGGISPDVRQYHAGQYRSPSELPDGAVLVVGSAQSGLQVAEDIIDRGKRVFLSTSAVGRVPRKYRGKDILDWLLTVGFYDVKAEEVTDPNELEMKQPQVSGVGPFGRTHSLQSLAEKGSVIIGRIDTARGNMVNVQPNAVDHVKFADEISRRLKGLIDKFIAEHHLDAPPPAPNPADEPDTDGRCASPIRELNLQKENIRSIVWATGFAGDFSYLKKNILDGNGRPVHRNGISPSNGLYYLGLPWLRKRKSGIVNGITEDATFLAESLTSGRASSS